MEVLFCFGYQIASFFDEVTYGHHPLLWTKCIELLYFHIKGTNTPFIKTVAHNESQISC